MLGTRSVPSGHTAHVLHDHRALADTLRTAHRLHARPGSETEVLLRSPGAAAAQRNTFSVAATASAAPSDRASGSSGIDGGSGRRGHSTSSRVAVLRAAISGSDLRSVPGIGPKNEQLLVARGHPSLDALQQHFSEDIRGDTSAMSRYLRVSYCSFSTQLLLLECFLDRALWCLSWILLALSPHAAAT